MYAIGAFFGSPLLPSSGVLAWAALAGYALLAGRHAPRATRVALVVGLLVFGGWAAVEELATTATTTDFGWFAYTSPPSVDLRTAWSQGLREIAPWLIGYACLTVAAFAMGTRAPAPHGRLIGIFGAALALAWGVLVLSSRADGVREWLVYPAVLLPPAALAVAAFVAAGRVAARPLAAAGLILVGLAALALYDGALSGMWQWRPGTGGIHTLNAAVMLSVTGPDTGPDIWAVLGVAVPLVAAAAVTVGCLRRGATPS
ncbi:hypothetical protein WEI85_11400 [Actinomycetes bacterium KLBMP 9797]